MLHCYANLPMLLLLSLLPIQIDRKLLSRHELRR